MKTDIDTLLKFDPLDVAERLTGEKVGDSNIASGLGFLLFQGHHQAKEDALLEAGDTLLSNGLDRYIEIVERFGFTNVLEVLFENSDGGGGIEFFFAHPDGLLLHFTTYKGNRVNGGKVYYNVRRSEALWSMLSSGHMSRNGEDVWIGDHDCREALIHKLTKLRDHCGFVKPWVGRPFLWLLNYAEDKIPGFDYGTINTKKVAMLPAWVQEFMGPARDENTGIVQG